MIVSRPRQDSFDSAPPALQQIIWNKGRIVLARTHYWYQHVSGVSTRKLSPEERVVFHQERGGPVIKRLKEWLAAQLAEHRTEPNSGLGKAIAYRLRHWTQLEARSVEGGRRRGWQRSSTRGSRSDDVVARQAARTGQRRHSNTRGTTDIFLRPRAQENGLRPFSERRSRGFMFKEQQMEKRFWHVVGLIGLAIWDNARAAVLRGQSQTRHRLGIGRSNAAMWNQVNGKKRRKKMPFSWSRPRRH